MSTRPLAISAPGMMTAVGFSAPSSCAAISCGINNFRETRFIDSCGEWIVGSEVPLEQPWRGIGKQSRMLISVIKESLSKEPQLDLESTPALICIAERSRPGRLNNIRQGLAAELSQVIRLHRHSKFISQGRVGAAVAMREARRLIYDDRYSAVIIAGVDSYLNAETLTSLDRRKRLLTPKNSDGFIPGEAASSLVVTKPALSKKPQLLLLGVGFGVEKSTIESEHPNRADGIVEAIRNAVSESGCSVNALDFRITDLSGEQYSFKEAAVALARLLRSRKEEMDLWHAADCIGETGASAGPIAFCNAWAATHKTYSKGSAILCHFGNDDGKRAAAILHYQAIE